MSNGRVLRSAYQRKRTTYWSQDPTHFPLSRYGMSLYSEKRSVWTVSPEISALRAMALIAVLHMLSRHYEGLSHLAFG